MKFEKLKFEKIIKDNEIIFKINDKYVTEEVYDKMLEDDSLYTYTLPPLPKMNGSPENSCNNVDNNEDDSEQCQCEECMELLTIIQDIREMSDNEALDGLRNYLDTVKIKTQFETKAEVYNELGNSMIKVSGKLEGQLEMFLSQFEVGE